MKTTFHHARPILLLACFLLSVSASAQTTTSNSSAHSPHLTSSQWREDLKFAVDEFLERDRSFNLQERAQFRSRIKALEETVESKTDEQIIVELARAVALARNAHTRLYLLRNRSDLRRYPIRLWWFSDGLYVVRATPDHLVLLGKKVIRIAGRAVANLRQDVAPLYAGNASWRTYMSTYTMTSPEILMGLGLVSRNGRTEI